MLLENCAEFIILRETLGIESNVYTYTDVVVFFFQGNVI